MAIDFKRFLKAIGIKNSLDMSKQLVLQVSDSATTSTTTTVVANQTTDVTINLGNISGTAQVASTTLTPNRIVAVAADGSLTSSPINPLDASAQKITNLATPTTNSDAATKQYVDSQVVGGGANSTLSNLTAPTAVNQDLIFNKTNPEIKSSDTVSGRPQTLTVSGGDTTSSSGMGVRGGDVTFKSGDYNGPAPLPGGQLNIISGSSLNGTTGIINIQTSDSVASGQFSGDTNIKTGSGDGTGNLNILTGDAATDVSGSISLISGASSTTRGDLNIDVNNVVLNSSAQIKDVADPTDPQDVATKAYVDSSGGGANTTLSNLVSPTAVNQDLIFDTGSAAFIKTEDSSISGTQVLRLQSGDSTNDASGDVTISSGIALNDVSGAMDISTGDGTTSGNIQLATGSGSTSGMVQLVTGNATTDSGDVSVFSGPSGTANSGDVSIGTGISSGADSGNVSITTANSSGGTKKAGNINITAGTNGSVGGGGKVNITGGIAGEVNITTANAGGNAPGGINIVTGSTSIPGSLGSISIRTQNTQANISLITGIVDASQSTIGMVMPNRTTDPAGIAGMVYFNISTSKFRGYNGTTWQDLN